MKILPEDLLYYNKAKYINSDEYGKLIFQHAEEWADIMEDEIQNLGGKDIVLYLQSEAYNLEEKTSVYDGISGYQHDCAILILNHSWKYKWHLYIALLLEKASEGFTLRNEAEQYLEMWFNKDPSLMEKLGINTWKT